MDVLYKKYKRYIVFGIITLLWVILLGVSVVVYSVTKRVMMQQIGLDAQNVAMAVSLLIAKDLDGYRYFLETRDVTSDYYRHMQNEFAQIKEKGNIQFIYTINRIDETTTEFVLDAEPIGSDYYSAPGDIEEENAVTLEAFNKKQSVILPLTHSDFGILLGSSAPILDEKGDVIGVVGIDLESGAVFSTLRNMFIMLIVMGSALLCLMGALLWKTSHVFLEHLIKDKLTGAYNKRYSDTLLQRCIDHSLKSKRDLSVMMLDLDHFKKVNDTYGHQFGDVVLASVSELIRSCLREDDFLIRYGGEEFLVFLDLNAESAMAVGERIRKKVELTAIYNEEKGINVQITISIGVTSLPWQNITGIDLINNADKALYKAKETRNTVSAITE